MPIAIVTGAGSGIGRSAAIQIARRGTGVVLTYQGNRSGALDTVAAIEKDGGTAVALPLDLGRSETFPAFRDAVAAALRDVWQRDTFDHLVNNAGASRVALFEETTEDTFDDLMRVLLKGPYFLTQTLLPLLADGGAIVNVTSGAASTVTEPGYSVYGAMKGGLVVLTRYLAKELSGRGIRVNSLAPGPTRTRLGDNAFERHPEVIPELAARTALGRLGEPDDVGAVIAALLGTDLAWITAQDIDVSGGYGL
ncbi:SDR family NAD(P)-dependent oxidoreductase [Actinoplanes xinjiangensis]|uniref:NAD(P)-dependent dehydrogenase (Short-subunit alcohol dehydrogenase family) n=1 Tax=Actinoplanes xinjiangensis TaxID=512350 RepID=A0A316F3I2_9ACTN|nr:SDR family oxidoreductase [Actinoplanes xinjiangensis]PWK39517.1 NAD(P)-dependent dehydrogenase (short-subunit alcohol dehydrogenase family) [Actinoplanes xinjiangensis]GIF42620.1 short-chain dehydrogenase [Actinoplanes xinjiangensis]